MADTTTAEGGSAAYQEKPKGDPGQPQGELQPQQGKPQNAAAPADEAKTSKKKSPILWIVMGVVLVLGLFFGIRAWIWGKSHASTDDAYVEGDLVNVSAAIQGTLVQLKVDEGSIVHKGDLIAVLDDSGPKAAYLQAKANYQAALTMVPEAERAFEFQQKATQAAIDKAQAGLSSQQAKVTGARRQVALADATTQNQVAQANAQVEAANAQRDQADAQVQSTAASRENTKQAVVTAEAGLANARQQVRTAERAVQVAQAKVVSAAADAEKASHDEERYRQLYEQDAVSAQAYDQAKTQARDAAAALDAARSTVDQMNSQLESARRAADQSASQVVQAQKAVTQADANVKAAQKAADAAAEQVRVARAGVGVALANREQVGVQQSNAASTQGEVGSSTADIASARAQTTQDRLRKEQINTAKAQALQAEEALKNAKVTLDDCYIYAPTDGKVVRKDVNPGVVLSPGGTVVTMTRSNTVWVEANFKETQLANVEPGQKVEIEVDALPGKVYHGEVQSINEATGASTALLPPDNSTGNFTKVVQRIPVRIKLLPPEGSDGADLNRLRQGMSVTATIDTNSGPNHRQEG